MCMLAFGKEEFSRKTNIIMTFTFIATTWIIAFVYPKVDQIMSILGGLCAVTLDYGIPTFCFVRLSKKAWTAPPNFLRIIFFGALNLSGFVGVGVTIYLIITGCDRLPHYNETECPKADPSMFTSNRIKAI